MKKFYSCFLTALLSVIAFTANAVNITINVDDPNRVEVQIDNVSQTIQAGDNFLAVEDYKSVTIKAKEGAFLKSVTKKSDNSSVYVYNNTANIYPGVNDEGETWTVTSITEEEMRDGSVSIWVDDASKVQVTRYGTNTDATLESNIETTVKYATATELPLTIRSKSYSDELYKVELNNEKVEPQGAQWSISPNSGDKIKIYANFPNEDYKVDFFYANEGTEGFITSVTVNGNSIADFSNGFTVKAGDKVVINGNTEDYKFNSMSINGTTVSYFYGSYPFTAKEATTITLDVEKYATFNATINIDDPSHVQVYKGYSYSGTLLQLNAGDNAVEVNSKNSMIQIKPASGCYVTSIDDGNGGEYNADYSGTYTVTLTEGMKLTIKTGAIERNQTANFYVDQPTGWTHFDLTRADYSSIKNDLVAGDNTIKFYEGDNPFSLSWYGATINENNVFQNGVLKAPQYSGSQSYNFTLADGDDVKVYLASEPTTHNVTFTIGEDVANSVIISEKISAVAANWATGLTVLDGTAVSLKAAEGTEIAVSVNGTVVDADAEGNITFTVTEDAAVDVKAAPVVEVTINPEEGEQESLKDFTLTFAEGTTVASTITGTENAPYLTKAGDSEFKYTVGTNVKAEGNKLTLPFTQEFSTPGEYTLVIPSSAYTLDGETAKKLTFDYTIVASAKTLEYTLSPEEGTVTELSTISLKFNNASKVEEVGYNTGIKDADGNTVRSHTSINANEFVIEVVLDDITSGEYTVTIPGGTLVVDDKTYEDDIVLTYNVELPLPDFTYTVSPEPGTVASLKDFSITFTAEEGMELNVEATINDTESAPYLKNSLTGERTGNTCQPGTISATDNVLSFSISEYADDSDGNKSVTLVVPASAYKINGAQGKEDLTFNYVIDTSLGISSIFADGAENAAVYSLNGTKVASKATSKLAKGVYIINGRKYVVK